MRNNSLKITDVNFTPAKLQDLQNGLFGFIACKIGNSLQLDNIALRRTLKGFLRLSFPAKQDSRGKKRFHVRPLDDKARIEIERQIFKALDLEEMEKS